MQQQHNLWMQIIVCPTCSENHQPSALADRRELYNDSVNTFNIRIQSIPDIVVAKLLGYTEEQMFKVAEAEKKDVKVEF